MYLIGNKMRIQWKQNLNLFFPGNYMNILKMEGQKKQSWNRVMVVYEFFTVTVNKEIRFIK